jgi:hypothetical protein
MTVAAEKGEDEERRPARAIASSTQTDAAAAARTTRRAEMCGMVLSASGAPAEGEGHAVSLDDETTFSSARRVHSASTSRSREWQVRPCDHAAYDVCVCVCVCVWSDVTEDQPLNWQSRYYPTV